MSINYIIATYSGKYREHEDKHYVLQKQLENLYHILQQKHENKIDNHIKRVTIICPAVKDNHIEYPNYYQKEKWYKNFEELKKSGVDCEIKFIDYEGNNIDHSYDQWIQGYLHVSYCEYNLLMEDDYCIEKHEIEFDKELIDIYNKKFKDGVGYLCCFASNANNHKYHAAISNGLISTKTFEKIGSDVLEKYYAMTKTVNYPQLKFSYLFTEEHKIPLDDISDTFIIPFWHSDKKKIINYDRLHGSKERTMIIPVQCDGVVS